MGFLYTLGNSAFAIACVSYTIDAFKLSRRPFNLIGCLLIDTGYILFICDKSFQNKSDKQDKSDKQN